MSHRTRANHVGDSLTLVPISSIQHGRSLHHDDTGRGPGGGRDQGGQGFSSFLADESSLGTHVPNVPVSSCSQAPVEIWEKILKCAISVSYFFEPDPITTYGTARQSEYRFETEYWESERTRNSLRRVCSSWNAFLDPFNHRYVRLSDVYHRRIPVQAMPEAIRLNLEADRRCGCKLFCYGDYGDLGLNNHYKKINDAMAKLLRSALDSTRGTVQDPWELPWNVEIVYGRVPEDSLFERLLSRLPRLGMISEADSTDIKTIQQFAASIRFLHLKPHPMKSSSELQYLLRLRHLTALRIHTSYPLTETLLDRWSFPSLVHLSIKFPDLSTPESSNYLSSITEALGKNLRTLYFGNVHAGFVIPPEMWAFVPQLESVQMPHWGPHCPPTGHNIKHVRLSMYGVASRTIGTAEASFTSILKFLPSWDMDMVAAGASDSRLIIQMNMTWLLVLADPYCLRCPSILALALWLVSYYEGRSTRFTDLDGWTLEAYILFMVKAYWKGGLGERKRQRRAARDPHVFVF